MCSRFGKNTSLSDEASQSPPSLLVRVCWQPRLPSSVAIDKGMDHSKKGLLVGLTSDDVVKRGINIYSPDLSVEDLWGSNPPSGGGFLDLVLEFYGVGSFDVPFYVDGANGEKVRAIERSPLSRELQEATVQEYKERIIRESISQVAAGRRQEGFTVWLLGDAFLQLLRNRH